MSRFDKLILLLAIFLMQYPYSSNGDCSYIDVYGIVLPTDECSIKGKSEDDSWSILFKCDLWGITEESYLTSDCSGKPFYKYNVSEDSSFENHYNCQGR
eukprot:411234_1